MPERGDDGMYKSYDGTKFVHEAEAHNHDLRAYAESDHANNTYLTDVAKSADGQAMGGVLGYIGVALIVLILPMYYIPNFIVRVLEDFGHTVNFWLIFFAIWVPILSLIIWVLVKSHIAVRILLSIALMSLLATVGVFQWIKLFGGGKDIPYDWYLQKFEAQLADPVRAAKIKPRLVIVIRQYGFFSEPNNENKIADLSYGTLIYITNRRSGHYLSAQYNDVEGWVNDYSVKRVNDDYTVKLKTYMTLWSDAKDRKNYIRDVDKGEIVTLTNEKIGTAIKVVHKGREGWFDMKSFKWFY